MHILTVVGARPQFIKCAPLSDIVRQNHTEYLIHTGQHYDDTMSQIFFDELGIPRPDLDLGVGSGSHAQQLAAMVAPLEQAMLAQQPDWVVVYGDTNSTLAAALAAAKLNLRIAHVEAGLRSFNRTMPEEVNRVLTDHVSALLFCPTEVAVNNLHKEGITAGVHITGDIMVDSVHRATKMGEDRGISLDTPPNYAMLTIHRPANTDTATQLGHIVQEINKLDLPVIFPIHPRTRKMLDQFDLHLGDHVNIVEPMGYIDMLLHVKGADLLITDSGGLQKEAYVLGTPCVTVRPETEWVETIETGWNRLASPANLLQQIADARGDNPGSHSTVYGDGTAAQQMVALMV